MFLEILRLLEVPIILYTITLTVIMTILHTISKAISKTFIIKIGNRIMLLAFIIYIFLVIFLININVKFFPFLHAIIFSLTLFFISVSSRCKLNIMFFVTFTIVLMPILVMVLSKHPLPLGDDSRFIGLAKAISEESYWVPYKYRENPYYQFFPTIPFLEYTLASVTGLSLENITSYYLTLKLCFYLAYLLYVYLIMNRFFDNKLMSLIAMLLLSVTPPLALTTSTQIVHQAYALIASLATVYMMLGGFKTQQLSVSDALIIFPLWFAGIMAHATYVLIVFAFMVPAIVDSMLSAKKIAKSVVQSTARRLVLLSIISLSYWIYTYILDAIFRPVIDATVRLIEIFTGNLQLSSMQTALPWYTPENSAFFVSWALIPSLAVSHGIYIVINRILIKNFKLKSCKTSSNLIVILGLLGLVALIFNYFGRSISWFYGQNFYWLYLLILPLSTQSITSLLRKTLSSIISLALISLITFYAVQDPSLSANTYSDQIGWADRVSWRISLGLSQYINSSEILIWMDPRLSVPLSSLRPEPLQGGVASGRQIIAIVGKDSLGLRATFKDPRDAYWFIKNFGMKPVDFMNSLYEYSIILSSERYVGVWRST